jgi:hypothetical protein
MPSSVFCWLHDFAGNLNKLLLEQHDRSLGPELLHLALAVDAKAATANRKVNSSNKDIRR